jgi:predicted DNA-binding transcriptional regulator
MSHSELEQMVRDMFETIKTMTTVANGLQRQCESLGRICQYQTGAILSLAGENPSPQVQEISEHARKEIEELKRLFEMPGEQDGARE